MKKGEAVTSTHVSAPAFWRNGKLVLADATLFVNQLKRAKFGSGEALVVRVEREEDAVAYGQYKFLFGYVFEPVERYTGFTSQELCVMAKVKFMPDGKTSLTQLTHEEMDAFSKATEEWLRQDCAEAFEKYGREYVA